jgi:hypothetical protein
MLLKIEISIPNEVIYLPKFQKKEKKVLKYWTRKIGNGT